MLYMNRYIKPDSIYIFGIWPIGQKKQSFPHLVNHLLDICYVLLHVALRHGASTWGTAVLRAYDFLCAFLVSQQHWHVAWDNRSWDLRDSKHFQTPVFPGFSVFSSCQKDVSCFPDFV